MVSGHVKVTGETSYQCETQKSDVQPARDQMKMKTSLRQRLKDAQYRGQLLYSVCIAFVFFVLGLRSGQNGPTLLDLQIITGTDLEEAAVFFTGASLGYVTGALLVGFVLTRANKTLLLFLASVGVGAASIATPYCQLYPTMILIRAVAGVCAGIIETCGSTEHMRVWGSDGHVLLQLIHFSFAFGGVISPLYTEPFLTKRSNETTVIYNNFTNGTSEEETTNVHYAFFITGVCAFFASLPLIGLFVKARNQKRSKTAQVQVKSGQRKLPKSVFMSLLIAICSVYTLYCAVEVTFVSFLMAFLVYQFRDISKSQAAYITAIFWASFAVARFVMIFVSKLLAPLRILALCCALMLLAFSGLTISAILGSVIAISVFVALAGISMSALYAAGFAWTEEALLKVTGRVASSILISASSGSTLNPLIVGFLMEEVNNMWFCYLFLGQTAMLSCVLVFLFVFNKYYVSKHYGSIRDIEHFNEAMPESQTPLKAEDKKNMYVHHHHDDHK